MDEVCFRDKRLGGTLDLFKHITTFEVDQKTSVTAAFNYLKMRQKLIGKKIRNLHVLCHGLTQSKKHTIFRGKTVRYDTEFSGTIQLGKENLDILTVPMWGSIRNLCKNIIVFACMAAHVGKGKQGTIADGKWLMKRLASVTNATVYASEKSQVYTPDGMQFKNWEGKVFQFSPNGTVRQVTGSYVQSITGKI